MDANELVLVRGMADTKEALRRWNSAPAKVLYPWFICAALIAVALLLAVAVVATLSEPDSTPVFLPGLNTGADLDDVQPILFRNSLVLALHGFACVAGFIAGSSLPLEAERYSGVWRRIHDKAGPMAIGFVTVATLFSLFTQAYVLGGTASTLADQGDMSPALLIVGLLPHALPELTALFLPLAAWIIASRRDDWHELLAATFVTVAIAIPILITTAFVEVYVSPDLILALR